MHEEECRKLDTNQQGTTFNNHNFIYTQTTIFRLSLFNDVPQILIGFHFWVIFEHVSFNVMATRDLFTCKIMHFGLFRQKFVQYLITPSWFVNSSHFSPKALFVDTYTVNNVCFVWELKMRDYLQPFSLIYLHLESKIYLV